MKITARDVLAISLAHSIALSFLLNDLETRFELGLITAHLEPLRDT
jgi:hypothetical protein